MNLEQLAELRTPEGAAALDAAARLAGGDPLTAAAALRSAGVPAGLAAAALTQAELRRRAAGKFGASAAGMFLTRAGLEQATRGVVARRRAERLRAAGVATLADLGCGLGADALAAARAGIRVYAVEADPVTAAMTAANVATAGLANLVTVKCGDATTVDVSGFDAVFCDPARRRAGTGRRIFDPNAYSPPWDFVTDLVRRLPRTVVKVAPGLDHALIPADTEAEWVSVDGDLVEAALWGGRLAEEPRRATVLPRTPAPHRGTPAPLGGTPAPHRGTTAEADAEPQPGNAVAHVLTGPGTDEAPVGPVRRYLYDPDPAVVRAHLVAELAAELGANLADPAIAYLYADVAAPTPYARCLEVTDVLPFSLKRLRSLLRERRVGRVEILKRGSALDPEQLRRDLRLSGDQPASLVLTRVAGAPTTLLCRPVP
ncbi:Methyltransferase domain-containing protein [Micromonospora nigra]|uniref:Methyltransferase domain-containing protein n=1 Tax=Micromonospora nigra TaxID=145857 RepID=A0A1C6RR50_9ACTN|nr:class I SAM-dependent methyltransferase [Micromonospora nigra]SCL19603.1 Methyltransferase domain-containing protein [Micromonospora nigra]